MATVLFVLGLGGVGVGGAELVRSYLFRALDTSTRPLSPFSPTLREPV